MLQSLNVALWGGIPCASISKPTNRTDFHALTSTGCVQQLRNRCTHLQKAPHLGRYFPCDRALYASAIPIGNGLSLFTLVLTPSLMSSPNCSSARLPPISLNQSCQSDDCLTFLKPLRSSRVREKSGKKQIYRLGRRWGQLLLLCSTSTLTLVHRFSRFRMESSGGPTRLQGLHFRTSISPSRRGRLLGFSDVRSFRFSIPTLYMTLLLGVGAGKVALLRNF